MEQNTQEELIAYLKEHFVSGKRVKPSNYTLLKHEHPDWYKELGNNPNLIYKNIRKLVFPKKPSKNRTTFSVKHESRPAFVLDETVEEFIASFYKGESYKEGSYTIFPKEKIAVEYCPLLEVSEQHVNREDLLKRAKDWEAKGFRSLHIFSDEWEFRRDIVKSIIKTSLGYYDLRVPARKCKVRTLDKIEEKMFFNNNHLQGFSSSRICIGLTYKGQIVSAISLAPPRFSKECDWELIRYANKTGVQIIGGFSKLLKHFRDQYSGSIVSYSDRRLFSGGMYRQTFKEVDPSLVGYFYTDGRVRESRQKFQKFKLARAFPEWADDTEWVIARRLGWYRVWDCGNWKFRLD